ncbi:MAG: rhodanese-like domain-containing protein [bacterium]|nr:rhodanese-like domain-containing protein [bacterium]
MTTLTAEQVPRVTPQTIKDRRQHEADLVVVDVRGPVMFNEHRVPGAISVPKDELEQRYRVLTPDQELVFY